MSVEGTKFQVNYKLPDGTLVNLYAKDVKDLETGLTDLSMVSTLIKSTSRELSGGVQAPAPTAEAIKQQFNAPAAAPAAEAPGSKGCKHGAMNYKEGVNAAGKAWRAYMCPAPKGTSDQCEPIWVR